MGKLQSAGGTETDMWQQIPSLLAAAHELKSPLVLIRQLSFQLEDEKAAQRIRLTAERSLNLVDSLTQVARLEDTLFSCEPIHMVSLLEDVAHELFPLSTALNQTIEIHSTKSNPVAIANYSLLRTVILGLCDNALAHNKPGRPIELRSRRQADLIMTGVRDYGPLTNNLARFRRHVGKTPLPLSGRPRSSGLGLMIAEQFAEHMSGRLHLRRHHDEGVTFSLLLPASQQLSLLAL